MGLMTSYFHPHPNGGALSRRSEIRPLPFDRLPRASEHEQTAVKRAPCMLIMNATYDTTITSNANSATIIASINTALSWYETHVEAPFCGGTVNILFQSDTSGLGSSATVVTRRTYANYYTALQTTETSANDATAFDSLSLGGTPTINPADSNTTMFFKIAHARAMGLVAANVRTPDGIDSTIALNFGLTTPGFPGTSAQFDLQMVVQHEVNEAIGLSSILAVGYDPATDRALPQDLFRYSAANTRILSLNTNTNVPCTSGARAFFSINRGVTNIIEYNNCNNGGDYGDW